MRAQQQSELKTMGKAKANIGNDTELEDIPLQMKQAQRWLVWRELKDHDGKLRKKPYYVDGLPRSGQLDSQEDLSRLSTFESAVAALADRGMNYSGLGFALGADGTGSCWQGVDLDKIAEHPGLEDISDDLPGYTEASPSGKGRHAIGYGKPFASLGSNGSGIEAYAAGRFFTVTGEGVGLGEIEDISRFVNERLAPVHGGQRKNSLTASAEVVVDSIPQSAQRDLRSALCWLDPDDRQLWIEVGHALKTGGETGRKLWLEWSQQSDKWKPTDARKWDDLRSTGTHWKSVFNKAQQLGWINSGSVGERPTEAKKTSNDQHEVSFEPIGYEELMAARLHPRAIVSHLLYADLRTRIAAGGTGKTTLALYEAATLALGRSLWGRQVAHSCRTAIVTKEDNREILVGRLRCVLEDMGLTQQEKIEAINNIRIIDVSGSRFRLSAVYDDAVVPHEGNIDWMMERLGEFRPDWIIFDPLVSFGVGESRVNDAEQALVEAFRYMRNRLDACVEGIHHTGKGNAREKNLDQYSGRGGSSLADGCRMVVVMQPMTPSEWLKATGAPLLDGESGIIMALPKLSFCRKQDDIYIRRNGYRFEHVTPNKSSNDADSAAIANQLWQYLHDQEKQSVYHSKNSLESKLEKLGISRAELRVAVDALKSQSRLIEESNPNGKKFGKYLKAVGQGSPRLLATLEDDSE